ncbi:unnamed protein product, partial [Discosporangium mesarthrocarpum]
MPLLLGEGFHSSVVAGLVANCEEVEVRSPLIDYCENLTMCSVGEQEAALQVGQANPPAKMCWSLHWRRWTIRMALMVLVSFPAMMTV